MEFAIVVPVLMLLLGGVIQFGLIFWGQNSLNQIVRDTGRWAASQGCTPATDGPETAKTANSIAATSSLIGYSTWAVTGTTNSSSWTSQDGNVSVEWSGSSCPPSNNSTVAWVTITIKNHVPIFFPLVPGNGDIQSSTQFRMEPVATPATP